MIATAFTAPNGLPIIAEYAGKSGDGRPCLAVDHWTDDYCSTDQTGGMHVCEVCNEWEPLGLAGVDGAAVCHKCYIGPNAECEGPDDTEDDRHGKCIYPAVAVCKRVGPMCIRHLPVAIAMSADLNPGNAALVRLIPTYGWAEHLQPAGSTD